MKTGFYSFLQDTYCTEREISHSNSDGIKSDLSGLFFSKGYMKDFPDLYQIENTLDKAKAKADKADLDRLG